MVKVQKSSRFNYVHDGGVETALLMLRHLLCIAKQASCEGKQAELAS